MLGDEGGREPGSTRWGREERVRRIERQLAAAQQIAHIGSWEWDLATSSVAWSDELYRIYGLEPQSCEITFESFLARVHPDDRARVQREVKAALERGGRFAYPERIVRPDGSVRDLESVGEVAKDASGRVTGLIGTCRDVTDEVKARTLREAERRVLEMVASGVPLAEVLTRLVLAIEEQAPPTIASVLLLDASGTRVRHGAAPHLPDGYNRAIEGAPIGPAAGSCGTAAYAARSSSPTSPPTRCGPSGARRPCRTGCAPAGPRRSWRWMGRSSGPSRCTTASPARRPTPTGRSSRARPIWRARRSSATPSLTSSARSPRTSSRCARRSAPGSPARFTTSWGRR
jgi:PAS domain S-box-containing protein